MSFDHVSHFDVNQRWVLFEICRHCMGAGTVRERAPDQAFEPPAMCPRCQGSRGEEHRFVSTRALRGFVEMLADGG